MSKICSVCSKDVSIGDKTFTAFQIHLKEAENLDPDWINLFKMSLGMYYHVGQKEYTWRICSECVLKALGVPEDKKENK